MASSSSSSCCNATAKRKAIFAKRQLTLMKKAYELSTLCGIDVCVICYGPDGTLQTWPKDIAKVRDMAEKYKRLSEMEKRKRRLDLSGFLGKTKLVDDKKSRDLESKFPSWDKRLDGYSAEKLSELEDFLEGKLQHLKERLRFLDLKKQEKVVPLTVDSNRSRNSCRTLEIYQPALPNFATAISTVPSDQQLGAYATLAGQPQFSALTCSYYPEESSNSNGNLTLAENAAFNHWPSCFTRSGNEGPVPYCSNDVLDLTQTSIPQNGYQSLLASGIGEGDWKPNYNLPGGGTSGQSSSSFGMGNCSSFMMPQVQRCYENGGFQHVNSNNSLMMSNFNLPLEFPQKTNSTPLLELGPFSGWNPDQLHFQG